ncbi:DUF3313 family protein [Niveispirillum irakense]|uniref:DUF3313 family protein n=1 Tax=Niveispirillum irakense TaxID=34011 RepID=UPI000A062B50|nr:DUF3313 family protein [Niveispirillum irakense]
MFGRHAPAPHRPVAALPAMRAESLPHPLTRAVGILGLSLALLVGAANGAYAKSAWDSVESKKPPALPTEGLTEQDHDSLDKLYIRPGVDLAAYGKVTLAPIDTAVERRFDEVLLSNRDRDHAVEYLTKRLKDSFGSALVDQAGPGVLTLKITITEYVPNRAFHAEKRNGSRVDRVYSVGQAAFQAVLTDSQTGQVVAVAADADMGLPFPDNVNAYTIYGDADRFTQRFAKHLAKVVLKPEPVTGS